MPAVDPQADLPDVGWRPVGGGCQDLDARHPSSGFALNRAEKSATDQSALE
jgi:hypothetical protein